MKTALVHYWLTGMRGGEKVLEALCELFPQADIFTHVCDRDRLSPLLRSRRINTTFINRLPCSSRWYKAYLPLMPLALECLDLSEYDLVISSESGPAKGVITRPDALHICYCHSPMRYLWDLNPLYRRRLGVVGRLAFAPLAHYLRMTDCLSAFRVDAFLANSRFVQARIRKFYRRASTVVHPPVDTEFFAACAPAPGEYYLVAGELVEYKRADLAVQACARTNRPLVVVGDGPERARLESMAGPSTRFAGRVDNEELRAIMARAKALLFPGMEDFGMVPVEMMACGKPVIAFGAGGALETVEEGRSGLLFREQSVDALCEAMCRLEQGESFDPALVRGHALQFGRDVFFQKMRAFFQRRGISL